MSYVLGSELFGSRISNLSKEFIVNVWEVKKNKNYMATTHALINFSLSPHLGV